MSTIAYHLRELEIAGNVDDRRRVLPEVLASDTAILDLGCGIGQSFVALDCRDKLCVGIDIDEEAIRYGMQHFADRIQFLLSDADRIPLPSDTFDLVFSRVSLPYTHIPRVMKQARRVLRNGGRLWMTLHEKRIAFGYLKDALKARQPKRVVHVLYILANGWLLKHFGVLVPFLDGRYESWQDPGAMRNLLARLGFDAKVREHDGHVVVEGRLV